MQTGVQNRKEFETSNVEGHQASMGIERRRCNRRTCEKRVTEPGVSTNLNGLTNGLGNSLLVLEVRVDYELSDRSDPRLRRSAQHEGRRLRAAEGA